MLLDIIAALLLVAACIRACARPCWFGLFLTRLADRPGGRIEIIRSGGHRLSEYGTSARWIPLRIPGRFHFGGVFGEHGWPVDQFGPGHGHAGVGQ